MPRRGGRDSVGVGTGDQLRRCCIPEVNQANMIHLIFWIWFLSSSAFSSAEPSLSIKPWKLSHPINVGPDQSKFPYVLDIVHSLSALGHTTVQNDPRSTIFPCDTWIFTWHKNSGQDIQDSFSISYARLSSSGLDLRPVVTFPVDGNEPNRTYFSYDRPYREEDLLRSHALGFRQKATNLHCLVISADSVRVGVESSKALFAEKYGRPHLDYFIYVAQDENVLQSVYSHDRQMQEIRFKYGFFGQSAGVAELGFVYKCERPGETLPVFSRKCFPHISNRAYSVVCTSIKPFLYYDTDQENEAIGQPAGVMYSIFAEAGARYNFTFDIEYSSYLGASGFNLNGTWYGAVGQVFSREKDIAFGVVPSIHRFPVVEPIFVTWMIRFFYIRSPPFSTSWKAAILPFDVDVWALTACLTVLMVIPVYYVAAKLYFKSVVANREDYKHHIPEYVLGELVDALNRILMEQSATVRHWKGTRIRLLILLWAAFCLVLGTAYRAKLINFLTFLEQEHIPLTHMELSHANDYQLFLRYMGGTNYRFMIESDSPMHKRIMRRAILVNTSRETMFDALFAEKGAWLDYRINAEFAMQENATLNPSIKLTPIFTRSKDADYIGNFGWIFHKGSALAESFQQVLGSIFAAGLYDEWINKNSHKIRVKSARWLKSQEVSPVRDKIETIMKALEKGPKALDNGSFVGIYYICLVGCALSALAFAVESLEFHGKRFLQQRKEITPEIQFVEDKS